MPVLEEIRNAGLTPGVGFDSMPRDMLRHGQLVGSPSNALDGEPQRGSTSDRPTVLLVDDDTTLLATFADILARGLRVVTATNGADAVTTFVTTSVDIVVTDLAMPDMNGLQVARRCKTIRPSVPVLMVTAWEALVSPDDAAEHGIDGILTKPVRAATLVRAIQDLLGERRTPGPRCPEPR